MARARRDGGVAQVAGGLDRIGTLVARLLATELIVAVITPAVDPPGAGQPTGVLRAEGDGLEGEGVGRLGLGAAVPTGGCDRSGEERANGAESHRGREAPPHRRHRITTY